ncbi:MAG: WbqC family protein [Cyclobacteriaceae bacterium]
MNHYRQETVLIELHYLPSVAYFSGIQQFSKITFEVYEHYTKQTYRNRCYILGPNRLQALSVPVSKDGVKVPLRDIRISYTQHWQNHHWRSIQTAYGNSPFFDFFAPSFHDILFRKYEFLIDLNLSLLTECLRLLGWHDKTLKLSETYLKEPDSQWIDCRDMFSLQSAPPGDTEEVYAGYQQVFGKDFVANLSVIDLLFCAGPHANTIISQSLPRQS